MASEPDFQFGDKVKVEGYESDKNQSKVAADGG
jgi:hypothetical protein